MRLGTILDPLRLGLRYDARRYWNQRFARNTSLKASGCVGRSEKDNVEDYRRDWIALARYLPSDNVCTVLEIGPGSGFYTRFLLHRTSIVTSVDVSDEVVRRLRRQGLPAVQGALEDFYPTWRRHMVLCIEVLQHIIRRDLFHRAVRNLARAVRFDGYILIGALAERSRRTNFHVHQWTASDVIKHSGLKGEKLCEFRSGHLWRFTHV